MSTTHNGDGWPANVIHGGSKEWADYLCRIYYLAGAVVGGRGGRAGGQGVGGGGTAIGPNRRPDRKTLLMG